MEGKRRTRIGLPGELAASMLLLVASVSAAAALDVDSLMREMKAAVEPARSSVRRMTITISGEDGESSRWIAGEARKQFKDGNRILIVILAPPNEKGTALLMLEPRGGASDIEQAVYVPAVRRVRTILPVEGFRAFLESDFTLADLGFVSLHSTYKLLGEERRGGARAYKIEETPKAAQAKWYYSRIVTWIAVSSSLPIERDFYDPSGTLWKVETFEEVTDIDRVPTVLRLRMQGKEGGGSTEINVTDVRYGVDLPESLFERSQPPKAAAAALW